VIGLGARLASAPSAPACAWREDVRTYGDLLHAVDHFTTAFAATNVGAGDTVAVVADYSPNMIAAQVALLERGAVTVPLPPSLHSQDRTAKMSLAHAGHVLSIDEDDAWTLEPGPGGDRSHLIDVLLKRGHGGFVVFTSGTTGEPKAVLHDFHQFSRKFETPRRGNITVAIFTPDHLAGVNTLFYALYNHSLFVCVPDRTPASVCAAIERYGIQFLPTSPTFLQLLLLSDAIHEHDLSSLELVTFGSEPMHPQILKRLTEALPVTRFHQVYGISELDNLRSEPRAPDSDWLRLRQDNYSVKVKDGRLLVKTESAMIGYLNAPSPFDEDGWFDTGDLVQTDGEYVRFLGRETDIINVGGDKVYPAEVENVILTIDNVRDATVFGQAHPITGQVVAVRVVLEKPEAPLQFKRRLRAHCARELARYKVPVKVEIANQTAYSRRFKRIRSTE
jgi:long-chain acyl-CoA synthetase